MTFAELRQSIYQATVLSTDFFAEDCEYRLATNQPPKTIRAMISHSQDTSARAGTLSVGMKSDGTVDEFERIEVCVSRDPNYEGSLPERPRAGSLLHRSPERDSDRRPFAFAAVKYEGDQHAIYIFQRATRVAQGGR